MTTKKYGIGTTDDLILHACTLLVKAIDKEYPEALDNEACIFTPHRLYNSFKDLLSGYDEYPDKVLKVQFPATSRDMITGMNISYSSICMHHLLPFKGKFFIGYIPNKTFVGISKLSRLVNCYARRLQLQEKLTAQVADAFMQYVKPLGVAVVSFGTHDCTEIRGVQEPNYIHRVNVVRGIFKTKKEVRNEFMGQIP